jgi:hypothetical protein
MSQQAPENQDRGLFGLFGKKNEGTEGTQNDQMMHPPGTQTHNQPQGHAQGAAYYPTAAQHGGANPQNSLPTTHPVTAVPSPSHSVSPLYLKTIIVVTSKSAPATAPYVHATDT